MKCRTLVMPVEPPGPSNGKVVGGYRMYCRTVIGFKVCHRNVAEVKKHLDQCSIKPLSNGMFHAG